MNLGTIKSTIDIIVEHSIYECRESLKIAFEISTSGTSVKSKVSTNQLGLVSSLGFRNKIWNELDKVFSDDIYQICKQVCRVIIFCRLFLFHIYSRLHF